MLFTSRYFFLKQLLKAKSFIIIYKKLCQNDHFWLTFPMSITSKFVKHPLFSPNYKVDLEWNSRFSYHFIKNQPSSSYLKLVTKFAIVYETLPVFVKEKILSCLLKTFETMTNSLTYTLGFRRHFPNLNNRIRGDIA
jgi:hypothetical protein